MTRRRTYRDVVREIAMDHHGYVTTKDAAAAGVPGVELPKLARYGRIEHVAYGLYQVRDLPPYVFAPYAEALLRVGGGAFLYGETVLALLGLAGVNPRRIRVAVPGRTRAGLPDAIDLVRVGSSIRVVEYEGLRCQPVGDALLECRGRIETARLVAAVGDARRNGYLSEAAARRVRKVLRDG